MARAPFTHTFDLYRGPRAFPPNALKAQFPGRRVLNTKIRFQSSPYFREVGYVTCEYPSVSVAASTRTLLQIVAQIGTEDRIACPALGLAPTPVLWFETVGFISGVPYVRIHYGQWPPIV